MSAIRNVALDIAIAMSNRMGAPHPDKGVDHTTVTQAKKATAADLVSGLTFMVAYDVSRGQGGRRRAGLKAAARDVGHEVAFLLSGPKGYWHYNMT